MAGLRHALAPTLALAVGGVLLALALYLPHLLSASWLYWETLTALWTTVTPEMGTRVLPWLVHLAYPTPAGHQLAQFGLHVCIASFVVVLLHTLGVSVAWAVTGGVGLLVNPIAVEAVRHGTGAADLFVALGTLIACVAGLHRLWAWMAVGFAVALLSKQSGIISLALVPLVLWYGRVRVSQAWVVWYGVGVVLVGLLSLLFVYPQVAFTDLFNRDLYAHGITASSWALVQMTATLRLAMTTLLGIGMTTDFDYDIITETMRIASAASLAGLGAVAWILRRSRPLVSLGLAWMLVASGLRWIVQTPQAYYTEYQFYVAAIGVVCGLIGLLYVPFITKGCSHAAAE